MDRQYVDSTMITSIGYDPTTSTLEVEFKRGLFGHILDSRNICGMNSRQRIPKENFFIKISSSSIRRWVTELIDFRVYF